MSQYFRDCFVPMAHRYVLGGSGVGKTCLISEIAKKTSDAKAIYIQGKFEKGKKTPYSALKSAFGDLLRQKLSEPNDKTENWKKLIFFG